MNISQVSVLFYLPNYLFAILIRFFESSFILYCYFPPQTDRQTDSRPGKQDLFPPLSCSSSAAVVLASSIPNSRANRKNRNINAPSGYFHLNTNSKSTQCIVAREVWLCLRNGCELHCLSKTRVL